MTFEVFTGKSSNRYNRYKGPLVSLTAGRSFSLNPAAVILLNGAQRVEFLYEKESGNIALRPSKDGGNKISLMNNGRAVISAEGFCSHYGLPTRIRFDPEVVDGMMVLRSANGRKYGL